MSDYEEDNADDLADRLAALALEAKRKCPSREYRCGVCRKVGQHFINDCPKAAQTGQRTPYQGRCYAFGHYECNQCRRTWVSVWSFANTTQKCHVCSIGIYPHIQQRQ